MFDLRLACTVVLFAGSATVLPPSGSIAREFASWFVRPANLPFAWQALTDAMQHGEAREAFARGQQIMRLLPSWTDGHAAFAYRYALTEDSSVAAEDAARAAAQRLQIALAWLEDGRRSAGERELELLQAQSFLPEVACNRFAGLTEQLGPQGGPVAIADAYLAEAERLFPSAAVREQRIFGAPRLAASLLANGDRQQALAVIDTAIARIPEIRDRALATEFGQRLVEVARWLRGERNFDIEPVFADRRFEPLWPYLR